MKPIVDELKRQLNGRAAIHLFDIDKHPQLAEDLDVEVTPTFIVYHNGNEVWRYEGEIDKDSLLHNIINPTE
jgi:thioredoxin 1